MRKKVLIFGGITVLLIVFLASVVIYLRKETPLNHIQSAQERISEAEKLKSHAYARIPFLEAKSFYDSAMIYWGRENAKWFFQRDFSHSIRCAVLASGFAEEAISRSSKSSKEIKQLVKRQIDDLNKTVGHFESVYKKVPISSSLRKDWTRGRILLDEGIQAYRSNDLLVAIEKLDSAAILIDRVYDVPRSVLTDYLAKVPGWIEQAEDFIELSRKQRKTCLIVDKYNREMKLYKNGALQASYEIELGPNWIGDKLHQGDKATPEGIYKVLKKKEDKDTKYYRALLLNYPNDDDKERFDEAVKEGRLSQKTKIGGLIEIHGGGGKGGDWTEGCVALTNKDIDRIFSICGVGTEVLIVGSLTFLKEK